MAYEVSLTIPKGIEVSHSDLVIIARNNGKMLGTLTISKGGVDWRPKGRRAGKRGETTFNWSQFAQAMKELNKK